MKRTVIRILQCMLALFLVFMGWYVADPTYAFLQAEDARNGPQALNRMVVYVTYIGAVFVTWICTTPINRTCACSRPDDYEKIDRDW